MLRLLVSALAGVLTLLATFTAGCDDIGVASDWERCTSFLGNSILEWPGGVWHPIFPILLGVIAALAVWWLLGRIFRRPR